MHSMHVGHRLLTPTADELHQGLLDWLHNRWASLARTCKTVCSVTLTQLRRHKDPRLAMHHSLHCSAGSWTAPLTKTHSAASWT
jgi:hypothetical protein